MSKLKEVASEAADIAAWFLLAPARWYLLRKAARIEAAFPRGDYAPGSYSAEMRRFAETLRRAAEALS